jgi:ketosteroid isomerase-like protein
MTQENVEIIQRIYEAGNARDVPAYMELLHPEVEVLQTELLPWGGRYHLHQGIMDFLTKLLHSQVVPEEFVAAGNQIVAIGRTIGHVKANGNAFDLRFVHVWELKDGKVMRFEAYIDTPQMLQALEG